MRSNSLKILFGLGMVSFVAWGLPACSDDDDGGGSSGSSGSGGSGASGGSAGSTGGSAGSSGSSGSGGGGPVTCGGQQCETWTLQSILPLPACCTDTDECGALSDATINGLTQIPKGCYALNQPGNVECGCPRSPEFTNPLDENEVISFPGCCRDTGTCGYYLDLTSASGPLIGCVEAWDNTSPASCTAGGAPNPCPEDGGTDSGADSGAGDASTD